MRCLLFLVAVALMLTNSIEAAPGRQLDQTRNGAPERDDPKSDLENSPESGLENGPENAPEESKLLEDVPVTRKYPLIERLKQMQKETLRTPILTPEEAEQFEDELNQRFFDCIWDVRILYYQPSLNPFPMR